MDSLKDALHKSRGYALILILCLIAALITRPDQKPHATRHDRLPAHSQEYQP
jgi:hypothetical protein